ncbi:Two pore potassium channel a [Platanthera guangdongensis]|uniref:Two pore potassium channel a n=1 Tax=Platanthera guangdongensis TaxID=2320717 RepID=A0ABR2LX53_9ASPA
MGFELSFEDMLPLAPERAPGVRKTSRRPLSVFEDLFEGNSKISFNFMFRVQSFRCCVHQSRLLPSAMIYIFMADDSVKQPLFSGSTNPPESSQNLGAAKRRRFRRCKTAPASDTSLEGPDKGRALFPVSSFIFKNFRPSFGQVSLFLFLYLVAGSTCFYLVRDQLVGRTTNEVLDALYFCIVTMTTVGYGDLVPRSTAAKLLACLFVFSGMAFVALFLSKAADYLVEKQEVLIIKAAHLRRKVGDQQMLKEMEGKKIKYKFCTAAAALLVLVIAGTVVLVRVEKLDVVDAFYCVCATITTLGYGDKSFSTAGGRVFAVFWILTSTISQLNSFCISRNYRRRTDNDRWSSGC